MSFDSYPTRATGTTIAAAIHEHAAPTAPAELCAISALAAAATAVQGGFRLKRPGLPTSPTSLYLVGCAGSGHGKSTSMRPFVKPIYDMQKHLESVNSSPAEFEAQHALWREQRASALSDYRELTKRRRNLEGVRRNTCKAGTNTSAAPADPSLDASGTDTLAAAHSGPVEPDGAAGDTAQTDALNAALQRIVEEIAAAELEVRELMEREPKEAARPKLVYENVTPTALRRGLSSWPSALISSADGGRILNGILGKDYDLVDAIWDGEPARTDTVKDSLTARNPSLSILLMTQPSPVMNYFQRHGSDANDHGLLARVDWALHLPETIDLALPSPNRSTSAVSAFQARVQDMLEAQVKDRTVETQEPKVVGFTPLAAAALQDIHAKMRMQGVPGGHLQQLSGHAAKTAERVARYACVIHVFNGGEGSIPVETVHNAELIAMWHTRQLRQALDLASPETQVQNDALVLDAEMRSELQRRGMLTLRDLKRLGPIDWKPQRRRRALGWLERHGRFEVREWNGQQWINPPAAGFLRPHYT